MLFFVIALAVSMGSNVLVASAFLPDMVSDIVSFGPSAEGSFKCAGGANGRYLCEIDTGSKSLGSWEEDDMMESDTTSGPGKRPCNGVVCACLGWGGCDDVIIDGTINGIKYAAIGKEESFRPEERCTTGNCGCASVKMGLIGCFD